MCACCPAPTLSRLHQLRPAITPSSCLLSSARAHQPLRNHPSLCVMDPSPNAGVFGQPLRAGGALAYWAPGDSSISVVGGSVAAITADRKPCVQVQDASGSCVSVNPSSTHAVGSPALPVPPSRTAPSQQQQQHQHQQQQQQQQQQQLQQQQQQQHAQANRLGSGSDCFSEMLAGQPWQANQIAAVVSWVERPLQVAVVPTVPQPLHSVNSAHGQAYESQHPRNEVGRVLAHCAREEDQLPPEVDHDRVGVLLTRVESRDDPNTEVVYLAEVERVVVCAIAVHGIVPLAGYSALHLAATHLGRGWVKVKGRVGI